jgi:hypothetical protein
MNDMKSNAKLKKQIIYLIVIVLITASLMTLRHFNLLEKSAKFMLLPILAFFYLGQYMERKIQD